MPLQNVGNDPHGTSPGRASERGGHQSQGFLHPAHGAVGQVRVDRGRLDVAISEELLDQPADTQLLDHPVPQSLHGSRLRLGMPETIPGAVTGNHGTQRVW